MTHAFRVIRYEDPYHSQLGCAVVFDPDQRRVFPERNFSRQQAETLAHELNVAFEAGRAIALA